MTAFSGIWNELSTFSIEPVVTVSIKPGLSCWPTVIFQQILKVISLNGTLIKADWASVWALAGRDWQANEKGNQPG